MTSKFLFYFIPIVFILSYYAIKSHFICVFVVIRFDFPLIFIRHVIASHKNVSFINCLLFQDHHFYRISGIHRSLNTIIHAYYIIIIVYEWKIFLLYNGVISFISQTSLKIRLSALQVMNHYLFVHEWSNFLHVELKLLVYEKNYHGLLKWGVIKYLVKLTGVI